MPRAAVPLLLLPQHNKRSREPHSRRQASLAWGVTSRPPGSLLLWLHMRSGGMVTGRSSTAAAPSTDTTAFAGKGAQESVSQGHRATESKIAIYSQS